MSRFSSRLPVRETVPASPLLLDARLLSVPMTTGIPRTSLSRFESPSTAGSTFDSIAAAEVEMSFKCSICELVSTGTKGKSESAHPVILLELCAVLVECESLTEVADGGV